MLSLTFSAHNPFMKAHYECKSRWGKKGSNQIAAPRFFLCAVFVCGCCCCCCLAFVIQKSGWTVHCALDAVREFQLSIAHTPCDTKTTTAASHWNPLKTYSIKLPGEANTNRRQIRVVKMQSKWYSAMAIKRLQQGETIGNALPERLNRRYTKIRLLIELSLCQYFNIFE